MKFQKTLFALAFACSPAVFAASNGSLGTTSTGSTDVSVTIGDLVQVLVEGNVGMGTATAGANSTGSTGLCIYRNGSSSVDLTLTSSNPDGSNGFRMMSGTDPLPYTVALTGDDTIASFTSSVAVSLTGADTASSNCSGGYGHSMDVTVQSTDLDAAPAGAYSDTVTVLVEPI